MHNSIIWFVWMARQIDASGETLLIVSDKEAADDADCDEKELVAVVYYEDDGSVSTQCGETLGGVGIGPDPSIADEHGGSTGNTGGSAAVPGLPLLEVTKPGEDAQPFIISKAGHTAKIECAVNGNEESLDNCEFSQDDSGQLLAVVNIFQSEDDSPRSHTVFIFHRFSPPNLDELKRAVSGLVHLPFFGTGELPKVFKTMTALLSSSDGFLRGLPAIVADDDLADCEGSELLIVERLESGGVRSYCGTFDVEGQARADHLYFSVSRTQTGIELLKGSAGDAIVLVLFRSDYSPCLVHINTLSESVSYLPSQPPSPTYITYAAVYDESNNKVPISRLFFFDIRGSHPTLVLKAVDAVTKLVLSSQAMHENFHYFPPEPIRDFINASISLRLVVYEEQLSPENCDSAEMVAVLVNVKSKKITARCHSPLAQEVKKKVIFSVSSHGRLMNLTAGDSVHHLRVPMTCTLHVKLGSSDPDDQETLSSGENCNFLPSVNLVSEIFQTDQPTAEFVAFVFTREPGDANIGTDVMKLAAWAALHYDAWGSKDLNKLGEKAAEVLTWSQDKPPAWFLQPTEQVEGPECSSKEFLVVAQIGEEPRLLFVCGTFPSAILTMRNLPLVISENFDGRITLSYPPGKAGVDILCPGNDSGRTVFLSTENDECSLQASATAYLGRIHVDGIPDGGIPEIFFFFDLRGAAVGTDREHLVRQIQAAVRTGPPEVGKPSGTISQKQFDDYSSDSLLRAKFDKILEHANVLPCPVDVPFAVELDQGGQKARFYCMEEVSPQREDSTEEPLSAVEHPSWFFSLNANIQKTLTIQPRGGGQIEVTGEGFGDLKCQNASEYGQGEFGSSRSAFDLDDDDQPPCVLSDSLIYPYYGSVRVMYSDSSQTRYFLIFDLHRVVGKLGVPTTASTQSRGDSVTAMRAVLRALKKALTRGRGWLEPRMEAVKLQRFLAEEHEHDDKERTTPSVDSTQAKLLELHKFLSESFGTLLTAHFWAELAFLQKAKFAVLVVKDGVLEVKLPAMTQQTVVHAEGVKFSWDSENRISVQGGGSKLSQVVLNEQFGEQNSFCSPEDDHLQSVPPHSYSCKPDEPFAGWFELNKQGEQDEQGATSETLPIEPTTSFLVFALGDERRILETAIKVILASLGADRVLVSGSVYNLRMFANLFHESLQISRRKSLRATYAEVQIAQGTGMRLSWREFPTGEDGHFSFPDDCPFNLRLKSNTFELLDGWTGSSLEGSQQPTGSITQAYHPIIRFDSQSPIPESPLIGSWVVKAPSATQSASSVTPTSSTGSHSVLLLFDLYRVDDGDDFQVKAAIALANNGLPLHYSNPLAPLDMQRPIYEVFAFSYQVQLLLDKEMGFNAKLRSNAGMLQVDVKPKPYYAALVVSGKRINSLRVSRAGTDILISKESLSREGNISIRWLNTDEGEIRIMVIREQLVDDTEQHEHVYNQLANDVIKISLTDSINIYVVGGFDTNQLAVQVAAIVDMVEFGWSFANHVSYRKATEYGQPPQLVIVNRGGHLTLPSHDPRQIELSPGVLTFDGQALLPNQLSLIDCHFSIGLASHCSRYKDGGSQVILYSAYGVGPKDIHLTLNALRDEAKADQEKAARKLAEEQAVAARTAADAVNQARAAAEADKQAKVAAEAEKQARAAAERAARRAAKQAAAELAAAENARALAAEAAAQRAAFLAHKARRSRTLRGRSSHGALTPSFRYLPSARTHSKPPVQPRQSATFRGTISSKSSTDDDDTDDTDDADTDDDDPDDDDTDDTDDEGEDNASKPVPSGSQGLAGVTLR